MFTFDEIFNFFQIDERRDDFRKYLEKSGVIEKLTLAFSKLYQERPEDPLKFIRSEISCGLPHPEEVQSIKNQIETLTAEKKTADIDESAKKVEKKMSNKEVQRILLDKFERFQNFGDEGNSSSLLKIHLTKKILDKLMKKKTKFSGNLLDNIKSGLTDYSQDIGVFASDQDAYIKFAMLFDLILEDFHVNSIKPKIEGEADSLDKEPENEHVDSVVDTLVDLDPESKFIESISIKISRNINGIPFVSIAKVEQMIEVAEKIKNVLTDINDDDDNEDLKGKFYDLAELDEEDMSKWVNNDISLDRLENSKARDINRFWPHARGVFINDKNNIKLWINKEEHFQVVSHEIGGNLKSVYSRVNQLMEKFKDTIEFCQHSKWGYLAHNLKNIGHSTRIAVQMKISQLVREENEEKWKKLTENVFVKNEEGIVELISKRTVGISEVDLANQFQKSIMDIINAEKCLFVAA